jgi:hypothetical protein
MNSPFISENVPDPEILEIKILTFESGEFVSASTTLPWMLICCCANEDKQNKKNRMNKIFILPSGLK